MGGGWQRDDDNDDFGVWKEDVFQVHSRSVAKIRISPDGKPATNALPFLNPLSLRKDWRSAVEGGPIRSDNNLPLRRC